MESGLILIVDDEISIRHVLHTVLGRQGFETVETARGEDALALVLDSSFDAVLLDVNMPGMNGIDTCRIMRRMLPRIPILMLSVRDSEEDKVNALDAGANDYITKPFRLREMVARIRAAMRWNRTPIFELDEGSLAVRVGNIEIDPVQRTVRKANQAIHLTPKEFKLMHHLMTNAGRPIPHSRLLNLIWGPDHGEDRDYLRTFVRQLRKKIEDDPSAPKYLLTEAGFGYRFVQTM
jgi:two-component system KDP operon response regulator KdpE